MRYEMSKIASQATDDISMVPDGWIIKYFCEKHNNKIDEPFDGRTIRTRSFWAEDNTPSLFFFMKNGKYLFKDFSSDLGGNAVHFVYLLEHCTSHADARYKISMAWLNFQQEGHVYHVPAIAKEYIDGKIKGEYIQLPTDWERKHINFWKQFQISEETLFKFNVIPLEGYRYISPTNHVATFKPDLCFAFKCRQGTYQIYIPNSQPKYIRLINSYYPGMEQLSSTNKTLGILSGLKDIMAFYEYGLAVDCISGISESSLIDETTMTHLLDKYPKRFSLGDNDAVGIRMMELYNQIYDIPPVHLKIEKDVAENNKRHTLSFLSVFTTIVIDKQLNKANDNSTISVQPVRISDDREHANEADVNT